MSERKLDVGFHLPKRVEARPRKGGGFTFRYHKPSGEKIVLGKSYEEAIARYEMIVGEVSVGETNRIDPREVWERHRKGAKQRGKLFELTLSDVEQMLSQQRGRCAVTGIAFTNAKPPTARMRPWTASIDRIRSTEGYVSGNVRLVCAFANVAMNDFGEEVLMSLIEKIVRRIVREEVLTSVESLGFRVAGKQYPDAELREKRGNEVGKSVNNQCLLSD
jgi:hypothetical protein